jgi:hypothetical protein
MQQSHRSRNKSHTLYSANTDPVLPRMTLPLPAYQFNRHDPWHRRLASGLQRALVFIISKIILVINFGLTLLLLLLFTRFLLTAFSLHSSLFASWVTEISNFPLLPFNNLLPTLLYRGLLIDINTLIAILTYTIAIKLVTGFLRSLTGSRKNYKDQAPQSW